MEMSSSGPDAPPAPEKLRLKVVEGNAAGTVIEVEEEFVIGRAAEGDGTLASDVEISRQHARISAETDGRFGIEDLGSTNGTYINGRRLEERTTLETGDRIAVGASTLVVQVGSLQPTPPASDTIAPPPAAAPVPAAEEAPQAEAGAGELAPFPNQEEAPAPEAAPAVLDDAEPAAPSTPAFALRIEVDVAAGLARVALDEGSDEVRLVLEDGRWRIA
jgi:pSer/pThr/pTyr-binding forkhead associated (FHA) protein